MMITSSVYILYERAYDGEDSIEVEWRADEHCMLQNAENSIL
jgi:hypothetical protein